MATATAYQQVNMDTPDFSYDTMSIATPTHIQFRSGSDVLNLYGSFSYVFGFLTGGTITSLDAFDDVGKIYEISGGAFDVLTVFNYIFSSNYSGLLQYLFAGNDLIKGSAYGDVLNGHAGNDTINGNGGNDILRGGAGADTINGGTGADNMSGGDGSDLYYVDNAGDIVTETNATTSIGGTDMVYSALSAYTLKTNVENGRILSTASANLTGNSGSNVLNGGAGNNTLNGAAGNDILNGGAGADTLNGGTGADNMSGGDGSDLYYVDNAGDIVTETKATASIGGTDTVYSALSAYTLKTNVESGRILSTGSANLTGNGLNNLIYAGAGLNQIDGVAGVDTVSYAYATTTGTAGVTLNLASVNASGQSTASGISGADRVKNIENITGSNYADTLTGNSGNNVLQGGAGNDALNSGTGNDLILGGLGNDSLTGGAGLDAFRFNTALNSSTNKDTIIDFSVLDDTIQLENAIFTQLLTTGSLAAGNFRASTAGTAADANDYVLYNTTSGVLSYDADGDGAGASVQITTVGISTHPALTSADFIVI